MGPIEKRIKELSLTEGLSEETKLVLKQLKTEVKELEKRSVNESYHQGFTDKERGKSPTWDYYSHKHKSYFNNFKFGQLN